MDKIKNKIETLITEKQDSKYSNLWSKLKEFIPLIEAHNNQITFQMPNYDIHDSDHSLNVLKGISKNPCTKLQKYDIIEI